MRPLHSSRQRLTMDRTKGVGTSFFTDDQKAFRRNIGAGRWQTDATIGQGMTLFKHTIHPNGTAELSPLESDGGVYLDLGGGGATDFAAHQPA